LAGERLVLTTLGFGLNIHHPYKPLVASIKKFKVAQNTLAQVASNFVNDGYVGVESLLFVLMFFSLSLMLVKRLFCQNRFGWFAPLLMGCLEQSQGLLSSCSYCLLNHYITHECSSTLCSQDALFSVRATDFIGHISCKSLVMITE